MKFKSIAFAILSICVATAYRAKAAEAISISVVADGLDNPRGISFDREGNIYVAESGKGGDGNGGVNCIPSPSAQYIPLCSGNTGALTKISPDGTKERILDNLTSLALTPSGEQGAGPADIKFDARGNAYLLTGLAGDPSNRDTVLGTPDLGKLYKVDLQTGELTEIADLGDYEADNNPDGSDVVTNPYSFIIVRDTAYVIDGGANTIYAVALDGSGVKKAAAFPLGTLSPDAEFPSGSGGATGFAPTIQSVPTDITVAPDGTLTVVEYTAYPYQEGTARIFSVNPETLEIEIIAQGLTQLTGVTYDRKGNLYLLQHINQSEWKVIEQGGNIIGDIGGAVIKIRPDGSRETIWNGNGLEAASELTLGPDGNLYISNRSRLAGVGQVIRLDITSDDDSATVPEPDFTLSLLRDNPIWKQIVKHKRQQELLDKVQTF